ncbi:CYTH domain-containing protein [Melioribacter sp. OK-6-Me]|uniref:CYTH domain-containing protein n=1 Tax=unclassified Melioribacter TaxID=2627329 RepID=UPI003ED8D710
MPQNLELKVRVQSHRRFLTCLKNNNIPLVSQLNQKDIYFTYDQGLLKLRIENGKYSLIKYKRNESGKRWSKYQILYLNGDDPYNYLKEILQIETVVEKKRFLYIYKNTRIHLDKVKLLGFFIELENVLKENKKDASQEFNFIVELLNLNNEEEIRGSYKNLIDSL